MPLFTTPTQFIALALVLVAGWLLGLASHSGGAKWRNRYAAGRDAHAAHRQAADQQRSTDRTRIAELERENARLATATPVTTATVARPVASPAARPAYAPAGKRGWFDWDSRPIRS
jgi:hypothetical protein